MKIKVNKNILWAEVFIKQIAALGVKYACISPGSRNTPLTFALSQNKKIKSSIIIDERSSAFYALGIAKQTGSPVLIVTTSGTAAAELYPAVIEAYKSRIPLIVCTADRPPYLRDKGANQTINQKDIFNNHIRYSKEFPLPSVTAEAFSKLKKETIIAFEIAFYTGRGPVHFNFPFEKPLEPAFHTDTISIADFKNITKIFAKPERVIQPVKKADSSFIDYTAKMIMKRKRGIILCGAGDYGKSFCKTLQTLSVKTGYPIAADGASGLRSGKILSGYIIENYASLCRDKKFLYQYSPEIIIQFGAAPTSASLLAFFQNSKGIKILVNKYGDWLDPSLTAKKAISINPDDFCKEITCRIKGFKPSYEWFNEMKILDLTASVIKETEINQKPFPFEGRIIKEVISSLPDKSNLIISNSLPIRDFDSFAEVSEKEINVFTNRGASGIDGIISTALGIARPSPLQSFLLIGDLAFYYDMNSIITGIKLRVPLKIILINNNGGGIFEHLPIAKQKKVFNDFFKTPPNINFSQIIKSFGASFHSVKNWNELVKRIKGSDNKAIEVIEIKTDAAESFLARKNYWHIISALIK